jgi:hypothetical protein
VNTEERTENLHANCPDVAYKPVTCDRCGRQYVCTPSQDYYCAAEGDHCCEPCLIGNLPLTVLSAS